MYKTNVILIDLIKKKCVSHMFKRHMSLLYVVCMKFLINWFVRNLYPIRNYSLIFNVFNFLFFIFLKKKSLTLTFCPNY
jgi:hypothetical protein